MGCRSPRPASATCASCCGPRSRRSSIAVEHPSGRAYLDGILQTLADNGVRMARLDAVCHAIKRAGSSCFMLPGTDAFIANFAARARARHLAARRHVLTASPNG